MKSNGIKLLLAAAVLLGYAQAFIPHSRLQPSFYQQSVKVTVSEKYHDASRGSALLMSTDEEQSKLPSFPSLENLSLDFDLERFKSIAQKAIANVQEGEFGTRGEQYFIAQAFVLLCILGGGVPIIGGFLELVFGPVLIAAGVAVLGAGVYELGESLSPLPTSAPNSELKTGGIYQYIRHPLYTGTLCLAMGGSIISDSASRIILTIVLYFILSMKADYEERDLEEKFPAFKEYKEEVTGKFLPAELTDTLASALAKLGGPKDE